MMASMALALDSEDDPFGSVGWMSRLRNPRLDDGDRALGIKPSGWPAVRAD